MEAKKVRVYKIVYRYSECLPYRGKLTSVQLGCLFFDVFLWGERRRIGGKRRRAEFGKGREEVWRRKK